MIKDVGKYIKGYNIYQRMKNRIEVPAVKLNVVATTRYSRSNDLTNE